MADSFKKKLSSLSKKIKKDKTNANKNLSIPQFDSYNKSQSGISEHQIRDFYANTNWGG